MHIETAVNAYHLWPVRQCVLRHSNTVHAVSLTMTSGHSTIEPWCVCITQCQIVDLLHLQANASAPDQQLPHTFQGIMQIGVMFTQITTTSVCLAVVQTLEAAVRWPDIVLVAAVACAVVAAVRTAAMGLVLAKYTPGMHDS